MGSWPRPLDAGVDGRMLPDDQANPGMIGQGRVNSAADDKIHEACGVFGVFGPDEDVARLTFFGLYALQHRGQESAGIATSDGVQLHLFAEMGLVSQIFDEENLTALTGHMAIGHTRYSTTGSSCV